MFGIIDNTALFTLVVLLIVIVAVGFFIAAAVIGRVDSTKEYFLHPSSEKILMNLDEEDWILNVTIDHGATWIEATVHKLDRIELVDKITSSFHEGKEKII